MLTHRSSKISNKIILINSNNHIRINRKNKPKSFLFRTLKSRDSRLLLIKMEKKNLKKKKTHLYICLNQTNNLILPIAACCKELHQVEDLTSQPGTIGTKLASRALYDSIAVFISLWIPLSICIFKCVHFKFKTQLLFVLVKWWKTVVTHKIVI